LKYYRKEFDEKRNTFKEAPLHDWASHGADAFRYFALAWQLIGSLNRRVSHSINTIDWEGYNE